MTDSIKIIGAKQHNLKNISINIPKNKIVVFTGVSGSGKSSLAFDTIYAEGQRRYVESLSSYARQFLGVMDKPDVDTIEGLSPAISIDQKSNSHNPRSTVGTITEIYDYLRLLFARIGHPHCPQCGKEIDRLSIQQITNGTLELLRNFVLRIGPKPARIMLLSPVVRDKKGEFTHMFDNLRSKGYTTIRIDKQFYNLNEDIVLIKTNRHSIDVVVDKITVNKKIINNTVEYKLLFSRVFESIEQAAFLSDGLVTVSEVHDASFDFPDKPKKINDHLFSQKFACPICNISLPEIEPRIFSFNSPHGACSKCNGIGTLQKIDTNLILNPRLSITEGGILPFAKLILSDTWYGRILRSAATGIGINISRPLKEICDEKLHQLLYGTNDKVYEVSGENRHGKIVTIHEIYRGIIPELERRFKDTESDFVRNEIKKYMREELCPLCDGKRLKKESLSISIQNKSIIEITSMSIKSAFVWISSLEKSFNEREKIISKLVIKEIANRLSFLLSVGLEYLTIERTASTLSGGESQRIRLASQIGSGLSGVLYVLDEPSIGLHQKDNQKLIHTLKDLRDLGNTVIVVEHDREMMENADIILDFGPVGGEKGGKIISVGTVDQIKKDKNSITGKYLSYKKNIDISTILIDRIPAINKFLEIKGCSEHNLKMLTASFPLNKLICVTGVSGSGKSTLVVDTLYKALAKYFNPFFKEKTGKYTEISGKENLNRVILIDQSPIGRTPRSNPATYTGAFSYIREIFSLIPLARARGYKQGRFSFNIKGGRCEACEGDGQLKVEMQFLPAVYVTCDVCNGSRYNSETLEIRYKDKNIADILQMTVGEASSFFSNIPGLITKLETLFNVGLSYIHLGQPAPQLSGGEAQRIKLASELSKKNTKNTLYILDEPTTGLHFADLEKLLNVLKMLVNMGNTVIVIEHNLDVVKNSDWIIDLGPEGGDAGGEIIATGTPESVAQNNLSYTGNFLKKII
ncbi:excinuclease ABC subunit A [Candidatus Gottesmanbacteria bacterium CG11_big_fil_rev_8_21_14_0_20_37_11]|uniref:UvrABC system protein A n=3 Tax=Candidatus Gottesmaniibacteriota TaxID=1752720 RepID=A0A2M7RQC4_9BACT|nr:MAG: excinuclease ABC subunit A [Candidatus Gottesmanbacteria bacterium CG1_02_37_22]PIP32139.1 MAG: excinuclease ABC subunit A [Candidatus Gottesmanbacteria bacterium CG23_combo_of_CG06-09_8_20_14_all_37_19]PIR08908.1 MAG: excinuclease ABC subunit A [Candidatus Gottesmanbacteria bacterium CG11_big_fil_rev_8_21_14_0_20_37_11]PIZ02229.1 MAG: excinuclease ABC subunit UvrA [Candidatus Gottesmanbacteria bacterium CG_4_10_14_0_8_um_filter_37_24]